MPKDLLGQEIESGSYISYATTRERAPLMKIGRVMRYAGTPGGAWTIYVKGVDKDEWMPLPTPNANISKLTHLDRIVVIPASSIPESWKDVINGVPDAKSA